ncbi:hypothetical protein, partial [Oharaeibacter diazotrophicus]
MTSTTTAPAGPRRAVLAAVLLLLAACSSGPTDFVDVATVAGDDRAPPQVRSAGEQAELQQTLSASGTALAARGARADDGLGPAMALTVIRQQQNEEARALLQEAGGMPAPA